MALNLTGTCVCGGSPERPNRDCERCEMVAEIWRLRDAKETIHRRCQAAESQLTRNLRRHRGLARGMSKQFWRAHRYANLIHGIFNRVFRFAPEDDRDKAGAAVRSLVESLTHAKDEADAILGAYREIAGQETGERGQELARLRRQADAARARAERAEAGLRTLAAACVFPREMRSGDWSYHVIEDLEISGRPVGWDDEDCIMTFASEEKAVAAILKAFGLDVPAAAGEGG